MDDTTILSSELARATQEMYKKNFELVERNKTLLILRKINEIILSSITDITQIAQQVVDTAATQAEFKAVAIFLYDKKKNALMRLAVSPTEPIAKAEAELNRSFFQPEILVREERNLVVRVLLEKKAQVTHDVFSIVMPHFSQDEAKKLEEVTNIKSSLVYPLIVRDEIIGVMIICLGENEQSLFQYQQDLVDRLAGVIGIAIDNAQLYQEIQQANEALKQLDKLKDEFVSLASHELRTPMTAIKSYLWMALAGKGGELSEKQKYYLERAYKSTDRLIKLVNDMLNVSRIESGRIILLFKQTKLDTVITDVIAEVLPRAQELGVNVIFTPTPNIPDVSADTDKIKEVLINLIGNSLKFTPKGGNITLSLSERGGMVTTSVADTGLGISQEDLPKLFQKFSMVSNNYLTKQNAQGTGLGLYISKSLIQLHGGKIWVNSPGEGKGTTFSFSLKIFR